MLGLYGCEVSHTDIYDDSESEATDVGRHKMMFEGLSNALE